MAAPYVAGLLGRPDLAPGFMQAGPSAPTGGASSPMINANANATGSVQVGQMSLGLMAGVLIGMVAFYVWTKGVQR